MKRRVTVEIDLAALKRNYAKIAARVKPASVLSVLKANAYGLGVADYAKALYDAGCREFGVAEPYEALELLKILKLSRDSAEVQILSSVLPDEVLPMVKAGVILPVVDNSEFEDAFSDVNDTEDADGWSVTDEETKDDVFFSDLEDSGEAFEDSFLDEEDF